MDAEHVELLEGRVTLPLLGEVRKQSSDSLPYSMFGADGREVGMISSYLRELALTDMSPLTVRSYAHDLLRWWRLLHALKVDWDRATTAEVEVMVGWMRTARNPQRRPTTEVTPTTHPRTGKRPLAAGYAPATINHALTVIASFYAFHARFGRGPVVNPVPNNATRRARLAHRSPLEQPAEHRRGPLRQKPPVVAPRAIPDGLIEELLAALPTTRDRALVTMFLSTAARATELLGIRGGQVDWARQRLWVISKGTRALDPVPASPEALEYLASYFDEHGTPGADEVIWRTLNRPRRPLTYHAARRVLQRANATLQTDWSLHDLRHTAITRMVADPNLTLPEVMAVSRHRRLSSMTPYLRPRVDEVFAKVQQHFTVPRPEPVPAPGYDADDFKTVFGG